jgi:uncharacterized protein (DUF1015 family)
VKIRPLRGYRYARAGTPDVSKVVAPPYDQISPETQERLYAMSPDNIVRVTFGRDEGSGDKYERARVVLDAWLAAGVWARDANPAIYPYHQTYSVGGQRVTRRGFIALGAVSDYAQGAVLPHERTHAGPKLDRLRLLEATAADIGLLFMLVSDPRGEILGATDPRGETIAEAHDLAGAWHQLWRIADETVVANVQALMASKPVIIADGHHRYETAVEYAHRHPAAAEKLMAFFALEAPGLTILPNHRLVHGVRDFSLAWLTSSARAWFDATPLSDPLRFRPTNRSIGVVTPDQAVTLTLRGDAMDRIAWPPGTSRAWRELAVSILHEALLRPLFGITDEKLEAKTHVDYIAEQAEAVRLVREGRYPAAFLIAATTPEELQAVVRGGEVLPQKSTHFYPKLLDGLLFHRLREDAS